MPKIAHYRDKCIGCNSCVEHDPARWEIDEDGKSILKGAEDKRGVWVATIREDEVSLNKKAAKDCPVNIIRMID